MEPVPANGSKERRPADPTAAPATPDLIRAATRVGIGALLALGDRAAALLADADGPEPRPAEPLALPAGPAEAAGSIEPAEQAEQVEPPASDLPSGESPAAGTSDPVDGPSTGSMRHLAIGAALETQDRARDLAGAVGGLGARVAPTARWVWASPALGPIRERADARVAALLERGQLEETASRRAGTRAFDAVLDEVSGSEVVVGVVDEVVGRVISPVLDATLPLVFERLRQEPDADDLVLLVNDIVNRVLGPILDSAIPTVLDRLNEDPSAVRALVRDQSTGIATELTDSVRSRTVTMDDRLEQLFARGRRRRPRDADS